MKFPVIDNRATGINLRRIMDARNLSVKDLKEYLGLGSIQSIYHWLNGICLPSIDNLYALSCLFQLPMDDLICCSGEPAGGSVHCDAAECAHCHVAGPGCCEGRRRRRRRRRLVVIWECIPVGGRPDHIRIMPATATGSSIF